MQIKYAFIDYSQTIDGVYENLEDYDLAKKRKVFDDMIVDMDADEKLSSILQKTILRLREASWIS